MDGKVSTEAFLLTALCKSISETGRDRAITIGYRALRFNAHCRKCHSSYLEQQQWLLKGYGSWRTQNSMGFLTPEIFLIRRFKRCLWTHRNLPLKMCSWKNLHVSPVAGGAFCWVQQKIFLVPGECAAGSSPGLCPRFGRDSLISLLGKEESSVCWRKVEPVFQDTFSLTQTGNRQSSNVFCELKTRTIWWRSRKTWAASARPEVNRCVRFLGDTSVDGRGASLIKVFLGIDGQSLGQPRLDWWDCQSSD